MNLKEAKKILATRDPLSDGWEIADARAYLEGIKEATQAAEPLLEMYGKLRDYVAAWSKFSNGEPIAMKLLAESLQVEREYREKALGEKI